ncbi:MAG: DUF6132 family protein [Candidatus Kryptonium sp.]
MNKIKFILPLVGAFVGYAYYYFIGCRVETCPITSDPYLSTLYGALIGLGLYWTFFSGKKKQDS